MSKKNHYYLLYIITVSYILRDLRGREIKNIFGNKKMPKSDYSAVEYTVINYYDHWEN